MLAAFLAGVACMSLVTSPLMATIAPGLELPAARPPLSTTLQIAACEDVILAAARVACPGVCIDHHGLGAKAFAWHLLLQTGEDFCICTPPPPPE